ASVVTSETHETPLETSPFPVSDKTYGPVAPGEGLWGIALKLRPEGITREQMMQALFKANPEAFSSLGIDGLKIGATLRVPSYREIADLTGSPIALRLAAVKASTVVPVKPAEAAPPPSDTSPGESAKIAASDLEAFPLTPPPALNPTDPVNLPTPEPAPVTSFPLDSSPPIAKERTSPESTLAVAAAKSESGSGSEPETVQQTESEKKLTQEPKQESVQVPESIPESVQAPESAPASVQPPESQSKPAPAPEPETVQAPESVPESARTPASVQPPESQSKLEPVPEPETVQAPESIPESARTPASVQPPESQSKLEPVPEPETVQAPESVPESVQPPELQSKLEPVPEPETVQAPESVPESVQPPELQSKLEPAPKPETVQAPEPVPESVQPSESQSKLEPVPEPETIQVPEITPEPVAITSQPDSSFLGPVSATPLLSLVAAEITVAAQTLIKNVSQQATLITPSTGSGTLASEEAATGVLPLVESSTPEIAEVEEPLPAGPPPADSAKQASEKSTVVKPAQPVPPSYKGGDQYGPVSNNERLWNIAGKVVPDPSIDRDIMMKALFMANPQAFSKSSMDYLKEGALLKIPTLREIVKYTGSSAAQQLLKKQQGTGTVAPAKEEE
ncbi:MAG: hypothetical protein KDJ34_11655, partial [Candidatus Competibacteraceae bacterium]|nr:hypothetical protein [Candidatus Competibacteraceae bacterium]